MDVARASTPADLDQMTISLLDAELHEVSRTSVNGYHTVETDREYIYLASDRGFTILDSELKTVGTTGLSESFEGKHMEDIYLYNGTAYIVDNVVSPRYLLTVDVSKPSEPAYTEVIPIRGIGNRLGQQAFRPRHNRWIVLQSERHMGGSGQNIIMTPMDGAEQIEEHGEG